MEGRLFELQTTIGHQRQVLKKGMQSARDKNIASSLTNQFADLPLEQYDDLSEVDLQNLKQAMKYHLQQFVHKLQEGLDPVLQRQEFSAFLMDMAVMAGLPDSGKFHKMHVDVFGRFEIEISNYAREEGVLKPQEGLHIKLDGTDYKAQEFLKKFGIKDMASLFVIGQNPRMVDPKNYDYTSSNRIYGSYHISKNQHVLDGRDIYFTHSNIDHEARPKNGRLGHIGDFLPQYGDVNFKYDRRVHGPELMHALIKCIETDTNVIVQGTYQSKYNGYHIFNPTTHQYIFLHEARNGDLILIASYNINPIKYDLQYFIVNKNIHMGAEKFELSLYNKYQNELDHYHS